MCESKRNISRGVVGVVGILFLAYIACADPKHFAVEFSNQESVAAFPEDPPDLNEIEGIPDLDAHRPLSNQKREYLLKLCDYLVDKRYEYTDRETAAAYLGRYGHSIAIPALLAVLRDEEDKLSVRTRAVTALGHINDKRIVMYLVEDGLGSGERPIMSAAYEALYFVSDVPDKLEDKGYSGGFRPPPGTFPPWDASPEEIPPIDLEKLEEYLDIWREWWRKNHEHVTVQRPLGIR